MRVWLAVVAAVGLSGAAVAQQPPAYFDSGNALHRACSATRERDPDFQESTKCLAYITAVVDSMTMVEETRAFRLRYCLPATATRGQLMDVVKKFLANRPEQRHTGAPILVITALREAFPCAAG